MILFIGIATALVAFAATGALIEPLRRRGMVDVPNERSSHLQPTPRGGGLGALLGIMVGGTLAHLSGLVQFESTLTGALLIVAGAGLADDRLGGISRWVRLALQIGAALLVIRGLGPLERLPLPSPADLPLGSAGTFLAVLWIVGFVNLTNFLDGIDGFAAAQGLLAGTGFTIAGYLRGSDPLLVSGVVLSGACLGFLRFNWHPARVFLGDVGSSTIGFIVATAAWTGPPGSRTETVFLAAILCWFFLADGTWTLLARMIRREPFWLPHRRHLYQRLTGTGLSHSEVSRRILGLGLLPAALGVVGFGLQSARVEWTALVTALIAFALLFRQVVAREHLA